MNPTFKILGLLLDYPNEDVVSELPALKMALKEDGMLSPKVMGSVFGFMDWMAAGDLFDLQEQYVLLFDRTRVLSLHLFEHVHGESRDRGQAMVDLSALYLQNGLEISARELPDYLPMFLEFLSMLPAEQARLLLAEPAAVLSALLARHQERETAYVAIFEALDELKEVTGDPAEVAAMLAQPQDDPSDLAELDRIWEEEAVQFGPGAAMANPDTCGANFSAPPRRATD